jgi:hypothetical protein
MPIQSALRALRCFAVVVPLLAFCARARAQTDLTRTDTSTNVRLVLDRTTIKAFEPVYLLITADHFADALETNVRVQRNNDAATDLGNLEGSWHRGERRLGPDRVQKRLGALLAMILRSDGPHFLFTEPGEYKIYVKLGPDLTTLDLNVLPAAGPDEAKAYAILGPEHFSMLFLEEAVDEPSQVLIDLCRQVLRRYSRTSCGEYSRAYLVIAFLKNRMRETHRQGGKDVYGPIAEDLDKSLRVFRDSFFGEELAYYTAYSQKLAGDVGPALQTIESVKSRLTIWGELMDRLKKELAAAER